MQPRLTRAPTDRMIAGVCGGLGHYFGIDPVIVRLIFVVLAVTTFITPIIYPVLWLVMPDAGSPTIPPGTPHSSTMPLPPGARFDPLTGQPLPAQQVAYQDPDAAASNTSPQQGNRMLGMLLMGIGGIILFNNVGDALARLFGVDLSGIIFPVLLVGAGLYLLRRKTA